MPPETTRNANGPEAAPGLGDTIVAEATPPGRAGVSLVRLSGPAAHELAHRLFLPSRGDRLPVRRCVHGHVRLADGTPDEATCTLFAGPASYTAEDVAELAVHGNRWVVRAVVDRAMDLGARPARPGEFAYRAYRNGRLTLSRAEAVDALVRATSPSAAAAAARQAGGALESELEGLQAVLVAALAELESAVDFVDDPDAARAVDRALLEAGSAAAGWRRSAEAAATLADGFRVVLTGPPNAGKSSLFNALLAQPRAIVTDEPGTTRDVLEGELVLDDQALVLVDTAGDREATGAAEREGVSRARQARAGASLVLHVHDVVDGDPGPPPPAPHLQVLTKIDLRPQAPRTADERSIALSSVTGEGLDELVTRLAAAARQAAAGHAVPLVTARQRHVAREVADAVQRAVADREAGLSEEYVAEGLRTALGHLAELAGTTDLESVYARIFSRFCIGK